MMVIGKKDVYFALIMLMIITLSIGISVNKGKTLEVTSMPKSLKVIVDAGHGEPDSGAVSSDGIKESSLNLQIAKKLEALLLEEGIDVIMTRTDENNIADSDKKSSIREMKVSDINKRIEIANSSNANFLISIHMNKFSDSKYSGWQTFYSKTSEEGKKLAECIQKGIQEVVKKENKRTALTIDGIKLVNKSKLPVVIVECGFLSNTEEKELLKTNEYQEKLAEGILNGIKQYCVIN